MSDVARRPASDVEGSVANGGDGPHDPRMEARIAVLEEIAATTKQLLMEMRADLKAIREKQEADYRGLAEKISGETLRIYVAGAGAALALLGVIAKGFKWI